jgi:hypothetical protein
MAVKGGRVNQFLAVFGTWSRAQNFIFYFKKRGSKTHLYNIIKQVDEKEE